MRSPIAIQRSRFDLDSIKPRISGIVDAFDRYLDGYPVKTARSKHSVMGPVAKILERAQTRKWDPESLIGYALRVHEMNPRSYGIIAPGTRDALEQGTRTLIELCNEIPVTAVAKIVERIDYSIYYRRRKKGLERMEAIRSAFADYLKARYHDDAAALAEAWEEKGLTFEDVRYPSRTSEAYKRAKGARKNDIDGFWNQYKGEKREEIEE